MTLQRVLVVNAGSSSLKFKLYDLLKGRLQAAASGLLERIGDEANSSLTVKGLESGTETVRVPLKTHVEGLTQTFEFLKRAVSRHIAEEVKAVGHRIVHGGTFSSSVLLDDAAMAEVRRATMFAPLHNPANLTGVEACAQFFGPDRRQVGVFDTAFHQTMPPSAFLYALPYRYYQELGIRRYGMHGTSYRFLTQQVATHLGKPAEELNLIIAHLGAGSSMCCIRNGKSIDTTMGMTPLEGCAAPPCQAFLRTAATGDGEHAAGMCSGTLHVQ